MSNAPEPYATCRTARTGRVVAATLVCLFLAFAPAVAEDSATDEKKFQVFGYLTQAYGRSSRGSILGTEEGGTTDLGNVAVQFRWNRSPRDSVVIQLAHERRGDDLFLPKNENVDIDWAFYSRRIAPNTVVKVGRLNVPLGIYNEVRDVGTLLPFFSLPISFYPGVLSSAETIDGASLSHTFAARSDWSLDAEVFFGGWDTFQQQVSPGSEFGLVNLEARAEDAFGGQFWLHAPVRGFRLGGGWSIWDLDGPISLPGSNRWSSFHLSIDMTWEKWLLRAEARRWEFDQDFGAFLGLPTSIPAEATRDGYYVQGGVWLTEKIGLFAQIERTSLEDDMGIVPGLEDFHRESAVSFNYRFNPDLQARAEFHFADTFLPLGLPGSGGLVSQADDVNWCIVALSVSF